uniref:Centromere protein P n=1 Tax=Sphenodon punctatus TaxID=8508 RepID=A0A8D0GEA7_SPHPU
MPHQVSSISKFDGNVKKSVPFVCTTEAPLLHLSIQRSQDLHTTYQWILDAILRDHSIKFQKCKYPNTVVLPEGLSGDYMILRRPELSGFELMIVWKIHVDEGGRVTPTLDLLNKIPQQVLESSKIDVEDAPHCFRNLLHLLGIEASIESLIKSLLGIGAEK